MLLNIVLWAITLYLVYVFVTAGRAKLNNDPMMIGAFDTIGPVGGLTPTQFRKITGGIELLSSIFLIIPPLTSFGATLLVCTDRKSTRLNSSHPSRSRMPSSA